MLIDRHTAKTRPGFRTSLANPHARLAAWSRLARRAQPMVMVAVLLGMFIPALVAQARLRHGVIRGAYLTSLPDTTDNIHLAMPYGNQTPAIVGKLDVDWGMPTPSAYPASVYVTSYIPYDRDRWVANPDGTPRNLAWWQAFHPDWIVYTCDRTTPAYEFGDPNIPLDITNPAVVNYYLTTWIQPYLASNPPFNAIGFDNVGLTNAAGRCGVWQNGQWVQKYSGAYYDAQFRHDVLAWAQQMYPAIHQLSATAAVSFNLSIEPDLSDELAAYESLIPYVDFIFDERGFTNFGHAGANTITGADWQNEVAAIQYLNQQGKGVYLNAYEPELAPSDISRAEIGWVLANYLLLKANHTYAYVDTYPQTNNQFWDFTDRPEYHVAIGHALAPMYAVGPVIYRRDFSGGVALVNPSSAVSAIVPIPPGLQDMYGVIQGPSVFLPPHSGLVLLATSATPTPAPTASACGTPPPCVASSPRCLPPVIACTPAAPRH